MPPKKQTAGRTSKSVRSRDLEPTARSRFSSRTLSGVSGTSLIRPEEVAHVDVETRTYSNGLRVISERVEGAQSLSMGLWVRAGSKDEPRSKAGIAHFIEHVVFKGTAGKSMREIMRSVESKGGMLNAFTTKEHTCYYTWTRTAHLAEAATVLFELAARPNFTERDIEREKGVVIEEINGIEDEPDELVFDLFESAIFGDHPLGRPIIGTTKSVSSLTREDLLRFHKRHYRAQDLSIVASGGHSHEELFGIIESLLHHVPKGGTRSERDTPRFPRRPDTETDAPRASGAQAHIIIGRRAPGIMSGDQFAIGALVTLLGVGMSSRLNLRLREELGLAYDATAFYAPFETAGAIGVYAATSVENHDRTLKEMKRIVSGLFTRPISKAELERTKEQMIGGLILSLESISNRMMRTGLNELYYRSYQPVERELQKVSELTLEQVRGTADRLLKDESALIRVSVVPERTDGDPDGASE